MPDDATRREAHLRCTLECIPRVPEDCTEAAWTAWCEARGITPLASSRRGWWSEAGAYIRGARWIARIGGEGEPELLTDDEIEELTRRL